MSKGFVPLPREKPDSHAEWAAVARYPSLGQRAAGPQSHATTRSVGTEHLKRVTVSCVSANFCIVT